MNLGAFNMNKKIKYMGIPFVACAVLAGTLLPSTPALAAEVTTQAQTASVNDFFNKVYPYYKGINEGLNTFNTTSSKSEANQAMMRVKANAEAIINLRLHSNDPKLNEIETNFLAMMNQIIALANANSNYVNNKSNVATFKTSWVKTAGNIDYYFTRMQSTSEYTLASLEITPNAKTFYVLYSQALDPKAALYRIQKGDTLYSLAKKKGTTVEQLKKLNNWVENPILRVDQVIIIKIGQEHVIQKGETLSSIARQYGVSVSSIKTKNGLKTNTIYAGKTLHIPSS